MTVGGVMSYTMSSLPAWVQVPLAPYSTVTVLVPSTSEPPVAGSSSGHVTVGAQGISCQDDPSLERRICADASIGGAIETSTIASLVAALPPSMDTAFVAAEASLAVDPNPPAA